MRRYEMEKVLPHWALSLALREIDRKVHAGGILSGCIPMAVRGAPPYVCSLACTHGPEYIDAMPSADYASRFLFSHLSGRTANETRKKKHPGNLFLFHSLVVCAFAFGRFFSGVCMRLVVRVHARARADESLYNAISNILAGSARG